MPISRARGGTPGPTLDEAVVNAARYFTPDELEELRGIAKGADVSPGSVISHNLRLMLDGGAGGAHFVCLGPGRTDSRVQRRSATGSAGRA